MKNKLKNQVQAEAAAGAGGAGGGVDKFPILKQIKNELNNLDIIR